jgi:hypothetical protein
MKLLTLQRHGVPRVTEAIDEVARRHGLTNVFNPSVVVRHGVTHATIRAESFPGERPFRAYSVTEQPDGATRLVDLSALAAEVGATKAADPKLLELGDELYVTFNTGHVHHGQNELYLQRLDPEPGPPQRVDYPGRRPVEKNWGFFSTADGGLGAVYTLAPLTLLRLRSGRLGSTDDLVFGADVEAPRLGRFPRLHIGSQPLVVAPNRALVAANEQWQIRGLPRKIYFGRLVELDLTDGRVTGISRTRLVHSAAAMLPQRTRHNPGLFSATYLAGLARADDGDLLLSYGVNDLGLGVARVPEPLLWSPRR